MEIKNYFAQDAQGNIMPSANCYLYLPGTTTLATGLVDGNGIPISNPFLASSIGQVTFGAPNGVYDLRISQGARDTTIEIQCADLLQALNETASFLGAYSAAPTSGNSGEPLQIYYRYFNTVDQLEYLYKSTGWVANNLDGQLLATTQGASLIGAVMQDGSTGNVQQAISLGDAKLRQDLADPLVGARLLAYGVAGRTVNDRLDDMVNGRDYGMRNLPGYDNRLPFQKAEAVAKATGRTLWIPGGVHPYEFAIGAQIYQSSNVVLVGDGGCTKSTKLVRMDGSFTDLLIGGEWDEGATYNIPGGIMPYNNGFPYTDTNIGHDIAVHRIYFGGNGQNAGYAPSLGPNTGYRGSNISMRCIDGITIHDVRSEGASNDCIHVARCRRIMITDSWVEKNFLIGNVIGGTRNGLTVAGTLGGLGFDRPDYMVIRNITGIETEDLAVAVQFVTPPGTSTPYAGTVIIDGIFTKDNATYGLGVEVYGSGENQPSRESIIINNVISEGDGTRPNEAYASVLISHRSRGVIASNIIIRKARGSGLVFSGTESIQLSNIMVDEYNLGNFPSCKGVFGYQVVPDVPDICQLTNIMVRGGGGRGGDTSAVDISGYNHIYGTNVHGDGTSFLTEAGNAVIKVSAKYIRFTQSSAINGACNGWFLGGYTDFSLIGCNAYDNGKGGGAAQRVGFNFGPGSNRTGRVSGCDSSDRQAVPTQTIGYLLGASATDSITITDSDGKGNITGSVVNLGMPNARVHSNGFDYTSQTLPLNIGGNGGYLSGRKDGGYHYWRDSFGMSRVKSGTATSAQDGNPYGLKVAVPANATASGAPGQWAANTGFVYIYTGDGSAHAWARSAIAAW